MLAGRHVVLGVSGGVAAYKAAYLARRLIERGAEVRCITTRSGAQFLGPQTLAAITGHQPITNLFGQGNVSPHTDLARWADIVVVVPATASTIARIAHGLSEDALSATVLASTKPLIVAPAMHTEMWQHPATVRNIATLTDDGVTVVGPAAGSLAGGDEGPGRLVEPEEIVSAIERLLGPGDLDGTTVLVSAGGTREAIDPVRYIGNRSSGKMGNAIAVEAARRGAHVVLVTAAPAPAPEVPGVEVLEVETSAEMAEAVWEWAGKAQIAVLAAAVADFRPTSPGDSKLRRTDGPPEIHLEPTSDILAGVAAMSDPPYLVGFAAETGGFAVATEKARTKGVDLLVANDVTRSGSGFGTETNEVVLISPDGATDEWGLLTKTEVAERLWERIVTERGSSS